ncbi:MAG: type III polyketide synthase [Candidatus Electrothrix sp. AU1_5]|nr:type III polyketide synthase [Candidatus Electrothrix gigas]
MPVLCKPYVKVPEYTISQEQTLALCRQLYSDHPRLDTLLSLVHNTTVEKRHIIQPLEKTLKHPGVEKRQKIYEKKALEFADFVIKGALKNAEKSVSDIDLIIVTSCTGFSFPSLTAHIINRLGFRSDTKQLPIAQLGCAAGGSAIGRAQDYCMAYPKHNVLIVSVEFCSLLYQPYEKNKSVGSILSDSLFGDAVSACVMRSNGGVGLRIDANTSYLIPNTERYISYDFLETGFHFRLNKAVRETMEPVSPVIAEFVRKHNLDVCDLDYCIFHTGGPRILNDLVRLLSISDDKVRFSRECLREYGNIASVVVFEVIRRLFENGKLKSGDRGVLGGFGPGITAEINLNTWVT